MADGGREERQRGEEEGEREGGGEGRKSRMGEESPRTIQQYVAIATALVLSHVVVPGAHQHSLGVGQHSEAGERLGEEESL